MKTKTAIEFCYFTFRTRFENDVTQSTWTLGHRFEKGKLFGFVCVLNRCFHVLLQCFEL